MYCLTAYTLREMIIFGAVILTFVYKYKCLAKIESGLRCFSTIPFFSIRMQNKVQKLFGFCNSIIIAHLAD